MTFKDKITNICGLIFAVAGSIAAIDSVPAKVRMIAGFAAAVSGAIIGYYTGKPTK